MTAEPTTNPFPSPTIVDPVRRDFGDKPDDASKRIDPSKPNDKGAKNDPPRSGEESDEDAGEGHKGPRVDATRVSADSRPQGDRSSPSNQQRQPTQPTQPTQPAPQPIVQGSPGSGGGTAV